MKTILISLAILMATLDPQPIKVENNQTTNLPDIVEFCAATLIVSQDLEEFELWKKHYDLDLKLVEFWHSQLQSAVENDEVPIQEIEKGAVACKNARIEENMR